MRRGRGREKASGAELGRARRLWRPSIAGGGEGRGERGRRGLGGERSAPAGLPDCLLLLSLSFSALLGDLDYSDWYAQGSELCLQGESMCVLSYKVHNFISWKF
jgi:hypothetical protein